MTGLAQIVGASFACHTPVHANSQSSLPAEAQLEPGSACAVGLHTAPRITLCEQPQAICAMDVTGS